MRVQIVNRRSDRLYVSALIEKLFEMGKVIHMHGDYLSFEVENAVQFYTAIMRVFAEFSRDSRGSLMREKRFFRVDDYPITYWYCLDKDEHSLRVGMV